MNLCELAFFKAVFTAVNLGADHFKGERPFNKHHFAIASVSDALGFQVKRLNG
jgi:hypothetical protein